MDVNLCGLGNVEMAGAVECQTASVTVPGLGYATVWVTDQWTDNIGGEAANNPGHSDRAGLFQRWGSSLFFDNMIKNRISTHH